MFSKVNVDSSTIGTINKKDEKWTEATGKKDGEM